MNNRYVLSMFVGFAGGILCRSFLVFSWHVPVFIFIVAVTLIAVWSVRRHFLYIVCACALMAAALGAGRVMLMPSALPEAFVPLIETDVSFEGAVVAEPDIRETTQRVRVETEREDEKTTVLVVAPLYPEVAYGERVIASGTLVLPEPFITESGRTFRYDQFLAKDGIFALVEFASLESVAPPEGLWSQVMGTLLSGKRAFQEGLARAIPEPGASLASGLITGGKQGLGTELLDAFVIVGLVHIVVLSGYNVMIVAEAVLRSLGFLAKRYAALIAGITISLFVLAAGAGAASVRAGLMAGLALLARATGRTYAVVRALLVVAAFMLLVNPLLLVYDPGFQLSFIATLGLILGAPVVERYLAVVQSAFWRDILASTIAAQLAVLPLLLYQTGLFSLVSLPANVLVLPLVPLAMASSAIAGVVGMLVPFAAPVFGLPAHALLTYMIELARFMAELPLAAVYVPQFPFILTVLSYVVLAYGIAKAPAPLKTPGLSR